MGAVEDYLSWRRSPAVGCMFARVLSSRSRDRYSHTIVEQRNGAGSSGDVARATAQRVEDLIRDSDCEALALVFPELTDLRRVAEVFLALGKETNWTCYGRCLLEPGLDHLAVVQVARTIPFGERECPSEAMVLGPFCEFPTTRRAPVTAFEIFVGEPRLVDPKTGALPTNKANLAHISMGLGPHRIFQSIWKQSEDGRTRELSKEFGPLDPRAKAKVSFTIPADMARELGVAI